MKKYQIMIRCSDRCDDRKDLGRWRRLPNVCLFDDPYKAIEYLQSWWLMPDHDYRIEIIDR